MSLLYEFSYYYMLRKKARVFVIKGYNHFHIQGVIMCGIIGYIGTNENTEEIIINNLKKLEYRGYDSSGICLFDNDKFYVHKSLGEIKNLNKNLNYEIKSHCGIAHTRWATHGKVSINNTHPHLSFDKEWCIVHNGIIENHLDLKNELLEKNIKLYGDTDTEVVPNILSIQKGTILQAITKTIKKLDGSFAFCILNKKSKDTLFLARKNSPLYVAKNKDEVLASSDPVCFGEKFEYYYSMPEKTICVAKKDELTFYDFELNIIKVKKTKVSVFEKSATKGNYNYFAEKEIDEIPYVINNIIKSYSATNYFKKIDCNFLQSVNNIKLIGCGTAYHACLMGAKYIQEKTNIECSAYIASEFRYSNPHIDKNTICIFCSQSGETADTLLCLQLAKQKKAKIISLVNVPYSSIAKQSNILLPLCAGMEIAVISTKAYNAMLFVFYMLSLHMQSVLKQKKIKVTKKLKRLSKANFFFNANYIDDISNIILKSEKVFFIGKGEDYISALEAGLKLKEITYINCVSLPSGELKHGTLSLVDNKSIVFVIATKKELLSKNLASASEIKSRGGNIILVTNLSIDETSLKDIDFVYYFDKTVEECSSMLCIVPFQLLAVKTCLKLGYSPDKPRNLAKSVTVE